MWKIDEEALGVVDAVKHSHMQLSEDIDPVGNIFMIFAHDLVIHFTGILIQREAKSGYEHKVRFPHVNKDYALAPFSIGSAIDEVERHRSSLKAWIRSLPLNRTAVGEALPLSYGADRVAAKWINLFGGQKVPVRAFLPRRNEQIEALYELIANLSSVYGFSGLDHLWENWHQYVIGNTSTKQSVIRENGLLVGTRNNLQNRKLAANFLQQGKHVVAITHGEVANSVMDEPPFGYSERTLCSTLIDYGEFDQSGQFNEPWIRPQQTLSRSGTLAALMHRPSDRIVLPDRSRARILYIPTTYHGNELYGPFHVYEDDLYRQWQCALFKAIPGLTFKAHPKSAGEPLEGVPIDSRRLEICIPEYDVLVFDYFATGAMLALVSDKPVIYLDIGLRNLQKDFILDLKRRCEYVKIEFSDSERWGLTDALSQCWEVSAERTNEGIARYVFCDPERFSWKAVFSAVNAGRAPKDKGNR